MLNERFFCAMCATIALVACGGETSGISRGDADLEDAALEADARVPDDVSGEPARDARTPQEHRATPVTCSAVRPAMPPNPYPSARAGCNSDVDCADAGANGRCVGSVADAGQYFCSSDQCLVDTDCGGPLEGGSTTACLCRVTGMGYQANLCVPADCRVDADCGPGSFCSPTQSPKWGEGPVALRCHTSADECRDDADCPPNDGSFYSLGYCAYDPGKAHWICSTQHSVI